VEIQIANPDYMLRSGLTTEIRIPVREVSAQKVSPALFALNDQGAIGVRIVNEQGIVEFHEIEIIGEEPDGVWVSGLPDVATLITVGQELVVPGEMVDVDYEPNGGMPASASEPTSQAQPAGTEAESQAANPEVVATNA
jgi:membrane fusion protein, multidrug efflux system